MASKCFSVLLLSLVIFGCNKDSTPSNEIFIYASMDEPLAQQLASAYEKQSGVKVNLVRLSTGEAAARIEAEKNNPQAAMWLGGVGLGHEQLKQKGLTVPYTPKGTEKIEASFKDKDHFWTGLYIGVLAFASNKQKLKDQKLKAPESWTDLLQPGFKQQIQISNPGTSGTSYNVLVALIDKMGEQKALQYFKELNKNISQYTRSGSAPSKNASLGETTVAVGYAHDIVRLIHEDKAGLVLSFPKDATGYEIASVSLLKNSPQPEKAKAFYDWLYTQEASQILADYYLFPLITDGVKLNKEMIDPKKLNLIHIDLEWAGKNKERLVNLWNEAINS